MNLPIATSSAFFLDMYARYRRDPFCVPVDWRIHFEELDNGDQPTTRSIDDLACRLIEAYRVHGHENAKLDPLGLDQRKTAGILDRVRQEVEAQPDFQTTVSLGQTQTMKLAVLEAELRRIYSGTSALEAAHVDDEAARDWIYRTYESSLSASAPAELVARALESISLADTFETFVQTKFPSKKRFGIEGAESVIVFLRELLRSACLFGFVETTIGGMHRGRLATLATVLDKPVDILLAEIKGRDLTDGGPDFTGDVPYHLGYAGELVHEGCCMRVSISPHPSHLMTVAPVVTGLARAKRASANGDVLCLLLHTDAAFCGQGLTSEVLQLGGLAGYKVGGTIHLVVNNQIGFTTTASEGRSSRYCTDIGKAAGVPILHVNGDDPVAVMRMASIALAWRRHTSRDILIDLVCYRRNGHNELDEPRFTQPKVWTVVDSKPSLRAAFAAEVAGVDPGICERVDERAADFRAELQRGYGCIETGHGINFATAEALAFASLLAEGVSVRLSGQDSVRGTFTQRHWAVYDMATGEKVIPLLASAAQEARFDAINSPLSEYAVLGFEYGHSLADPHHLTLWEAQFGDFLNGAQTVVDQFIVSAEAKWQMMSGLVILLPHGLEGQGPDHSSARIERLLQLAAGGNIVIANPSTPANLFHLLRRQIVAPWRKPLFIIAPKSLLRHKECVSNIDEIATGTTFRAVIRKGKRPAKRVVMCSGKIFYDLAKARAASAVENDVSLVRIEQLYPFPTAELLKELAEHPEAAWIWCQEEPENQGAANLVLAHLQREKTTANRVVTVVARPPLPVAARGSIERHEIEQSGLVARALGQGTLR